MLKNFFNLLWKKKVTLLFVILTSFFVGTFLSGSYNNLNAKYDIAFTSTKSANDFTDYLTEENLSEIKNSDKKYDEINITELLKDGNIVLSCDENNIYHLKTYTRLYKDVFVKSTSSVSTRAKTFLETFIKSVDAEAKFYYSNIYQTIDNINIYVASFITMGIGVLGYLIYLAVNHKKLCVELTAIDNSSLYNTPFHLSYWTSSLKNFKKIKVITATGLLFALMMCAKLLHIPTGFANLSVSFTYLFFAIACLICGPIMGFMIGTLSDILGFFVFPTGQGFFLGYTLIAALTGFIYGICLYKKKISFINCFFARFLVNIFMNVILGSIFWGILFNYDLSTTYAYMWLYELPKNIIFLIPQALLLFIVLRAVTPILVRFNLVDKNVLPTRKKSEISHER